MTTVGQALNIPEDVIGKLGIAQKAIDDLADHTEGFINRIGPKFLDMMQRMAQAGADFANHIGTDVGTRAPEAFDRLLSKVDEAEHKMKSLGTAFSAGMSGMTGAGALPGSEMSAELSSLAAAMAKLAETSKSVLDAVGELGKRMEKTGGDLDASKEKASYAADSLRALREELQKLMTKSTEESIGSKDWLAAIRGAADYSTQIERVKHLMDLATESTQSFIKRVSGIKTEDSFNKLIEDLEKLKTISADNALETARYEEKIRAAKSAWEDFLAEHAKPAPRTFEQISASVTANIDNLSVLKKDYKDLVAIMASSDIGSAKFAQAASTAGAVAERIRGIENDAKMLSQPIDQFEKSLKKLDEATLINTKNGIREILDSGPSLGLTGDAVDVLTAKLAALDKALADLGKPKKKDIETGPATLEEIRSVTLSLEAPLETVRKQYQALVTEMGRHLPASDEFKALAPLVDQFAERVRVLSAEEERYKKGLDSMAEGLRKAFGGAGSDNFKSMSMADLEQTLGRIKTCMDSLSRADMGAYKAQWTELYQIWANGKKELAELAKESEKMNAVYDWQKGAMSDRTSVGLSIDSAGAGARSLEELRALQQALYKDIENCKNITDKSAVDAIAAYQKVGAKVKKLDEAIKGVEKTTREATGANRGFGAIAESIAKADANVKTLSADFADLRAKAQNMKIAPDWTMGSEWTKVYDLLNSSVERMHSFKDATIAQNQAVQHLVDKMAYLNREMSSSGSAAVGRFQSMGGFSGGGLSGMELSIRKADTTAEKLKQDLADVRALLEKTPKFDSLGRVTSEWEQLCRLEKLAADRLEEYSRKEKKVTAPTRTSPSRHTADYAEAMGLASTAKTYDELKRAIKALKEAMGSIDPHKDAVKWNELNDKLRTTKASFDDLRIKMGELKRESEKLGSKVKSHFDTIKGAVIGAFSVSAIKNWMREMVEVHAQMRLQNVALRAILQNKDEADRIFMQVQQMALRSPFSIMQMTTFTKQLAAYRVESEKLVGTTKMLADVSAGLGVGMDRLILAYGQVKSANYLRATEVRQFTEAGLNIAGELSKYYSEIYGKMVSVGDVMDMVSKRMVKFEDVEEVFKRITSAGGLFYDMQKKQSDTVHGQLQRIKDAYTMMLDDIGSGNSSAIQKTLAAIRELMANWRPYAKLIKEAAVAFGVYKAAVLASQLASTKFGAAIGLGAQNMAIYNAALKISGRRLSAWITSTKVATVALKGLSLALSGIATVGLGIALTQLIGGLVVKFYEWRTASDAVAESLARIRNEAQGDMEQAVSRYKTLAKVVSDATSSTSERNEALEEINRTYGSYLPKQMRELEGIKEMAGAYESATNAIKQHYMEVENANRTEYFKGEYQKKMNAAVAGLGITRTTAGITESEMMQLLDEVVKHAVTTGETGADKMREAFLNRIKEYAGGTSDQILYFADDVESHMRVLAKAYNEVYESQRQFQISAQFATKEQREAAEAEVKKANRMMRYWESRKNAINEIRNAYETLSKTLASNPGYDPKDDIEKIREMYNKIGVKAPDTTEITESVLGLSYGIEREMERCGESAADKFVTFFKKAFKQLTPYTEGVLQSVFDWIAGLKPSETVKWYQDIIDAEEAENDMKGLFQTVRGVGSATLSSLATGVKNLSDEMESNIKAYQTSKAAFENPNEEDLQREFLDGFTLEEYKKRAEVVKRVKHKLGVEDKKSGTQGSDPWVKRLELMRKVNSEYEKLLKYYDKDESKEKILESFSRAAAETFSGVGEYSNIWDWLGFDKSSTADMLSDILSSQPVTSESRKKWEEQIGVLRAEVELDIKKETIENFKKKAQELFASFDLTKTISDAGLSPEMVTDFGGDYIKSLDDLGDSLKSLKDEFKKMGAGGSEFEKAFGDLMDKVKEREEKYHQESVKNWIRYTKESMGARGKIIMEAYMEQNRIMGDPNLTDATKKLAMAQSRRNMEESLAKQEWEDFKGTDLYVRMFEDLEFVSTRALRNMRDQLESLKGSWQNLSPSQLKAVVKEIEKLDNAIRSRNPFKEMSAGLKKINDLKSKGKSRDVLENELEYGTQRESQLKTEVAELEKVLAMRETGKSIESMTKDEAELNAKYAGKTTESIRLGLSDMRATLKTQQGINNHTSKNLKTYEDTEKAIRNAKNSWDKWYGAAVRASEIIKSVLEDAGVNMDTVGGIIADGTMQLIDMGAQIVFDTLLFKAMAVEMKAAMGIIGYILLALEAIATVMSTVFKAGDKSKQNQIDSLKDGVDRLAKSYEKLKERIEDAYKLEDYDSLSNRARVKLRAQIDAYEQILRLEQSKKRKDRSAIKEYEEAIEELREKYSEMAEEKTKAMGGFGSDGRLDAAKEFVDSWLDAFKETGDGLDALGEQWDSYIENLLKQQAAYRLVGKRMEHFFDQIDAMANANSMMSMREIMEKVTAMEGDVLAKANEELKEFFAYFGWNGHGDLLLSDLQKGIQNITAEQAAALESIANSMRFGIYREVDLLADLLAEVRRQHDQSESPLLSEVRGIRTLVSSMESMMASVVRRDRGADGRPYVKVN